MIGRFATIIPAAADSSRPHPLPNKAPRAAIAPATYGSGNRPGVDATGEHDTTCNNRVFSVADCVALLECESTDLALVVERWQRLSEAVRAGIVAMVTAPGE